MRSGGWRRRCRFVPRVCVGLERERVRCSRLAKGRTPAYWQRHLRATVRFADGLDALWQAGHRLFVEIGPHPVLTALGRVRYDHEPAAWLPSLRGGQDGARLMLQGLGQLYAAGAAVHWEEVERARPGRRLSLPTYPFQRRRHWPNGELHRAQASASMAAPVSPARERLVGRRISSPKLPQTVFETKLGADDPLLADHVIYGEPVLAASTMLTLLVEAARGLYEAAPLEILDTRFVQALVLPRQGGRVVQLVLTPAGSGHDFELLSFPEGAEAEWVLHAQGRIGRAAASPVARDAAARASRCEHWLDGSRFYDALWLAGYHLGPRFAWIDRIARGAGEAVCTLRSGESGGGT